MDVDKKFLEGLHSVKLLDEELKIVYGFLDEMANLHPKRTGLPVVIWFGEVGGQHGPRIKVSNNKGKMTTNDSFVVSVSKTPTVITPKMVKLKPSEVEEVLDWVKLNYEDLMLMWKMFETGDEDPTEVILNLKKI